MAEDYWIRPAGPADHEGVTRELAEYFAFLGEEVDASGLDHDVADWQAEYDGVAGVMLIAVDPGGQIVGTAGVRRLEAGVIELKRMWLRPACRGRGLARRLVGRSVAGHQGEALLARVEPVPAQAAPDAVVRDDEPAPLLAAQLGSDSPWPVARMGDREGNDSLLHHRRQLVGHLWGASLPGPEHLEPVPVDEALPAVVGRAVHAEGPAGLADRGAGGVVQ